MTRNWPFLVYEFDLNRETALHWATKRNFKKMVDLLLYCGSDTEAADLVLID